MRIKELYMQIELPTSSEITIDYKYSLRKKSYHIINYINRECFEKHIYESSEFNRIGINLNYSNEAPYVFNKTLIIPVYFKKNDYDKIISIEDFRSFIYESIATALNQCNYLDAEVQSDIFKVMNEFKEISYINNWIFKEKNNRKDNIRVLLKCSLTESVFELRLLIFVNSKIEFNDIILITDPDKIAYYYKFNNIQINGHKVVIIDKYKDIFFKYNISPKQLKK